MPVEPVAWISRLWGPSSRGDRVPFVLTWYRSHLPTPERWTRRTRSSAPRSTGSSGRRCSYDGEWRLGSQLDPHAQGLTYEPTGGIARRRPPRCRGIGACGTGLPVPLAAGRDADDRHPHRRGRISGRPGVAQLALPGRCRRRPTPDRTAPPASAAFPSSRSTRCPRGLRPVRVGNASEQISSMSTET